MAVVYQIFYTDVSKVPHSVEACWAYNTEVRRSKPRSAITFCCCPFFVAVFRSMQLCKTRLLKTKSTKFLQPRNKCQHKICTGLIRWQLGFLGIQAFFFLLVLFWCWSGERFLSIPFKFQSRKNFSKSKSIKMVHYFATKLAQIVAS